jgi:integrase
VATIRKRNGKFQARIQRRGFPDLAKTFLTRRDALQWARQMEIDVERAHLNQPTTQLTVGELVIRYLAEQTPNKKGARTERLRLNAWARSKLGATLVDELRPTVIADWRDQRLASGLSGSTVRNDLNTLSAVYRHAASEWGYQHLENPVARLKRPSPGKARTRRTSDAELEVIKAVTQSRHLAALIDLAVETAMRLSELVNLRWRYIDLTARTAHLPDTKNGHPRTIPLSTKAVETLRGLRQNIVQQLDGRVFDLTPHAITVAFRRACSRARKQSEGRLAADLRFHDLRHEAVSRLFERGLNPIEVASVSGHRSMQMLARYTHIKTASLVAKLR